MRISAVLFDIDGTLMFRGKQIEGAAQALRDLRAQGIKLLFLTNISAKTPAQIVAELAAAGIEIHGDEVQTAATVCVNYLQSLGGVSCHFLLDAAVERLFSGIKRNDVSPDFVVISDVGDRFNYESLNLAFRLLRGGAKLIALHKNYFWFDRDGPKLDAGAFIEGLEAASGLAAIVTGKPSELFFKSALDRVGCEATSVLVAGDDLSTDIAGAKQIGARSLLLGTGKYIAGDEAPGEGAPDFFLPSIGGFSAWFGANNVA
jgi:HAD superfamily hydrolase (TIGR01458 family)